jgi:hypothetical protein
MLCIGAVSRAQLTGTITVPSTTYPDLASVITALNTQGVGSGGAIVNLTASNPQTAPAGGYKLGSATLNASLTATTPLVINGNGNTVTGPTGTGTNDGIFWLLGTDYVTVNTLHLLDVSTTTTAASTAGNEWGYAIGKLNSAAPYDGCRNVTINGCNISLNKYQSGSTGILMAHITTTSTAPSTTGYAVTDANNYNKFTGNNITNVSRGIFMNGASLGNSFYDKANEVGGLTAASGNTIVIGGTTLSNTLYGVVSQYDSVVTVQRNSISIGAGQTGASTIYEYYVSIGVGTLNCLNNYFNVSCSVAGSTVGAIYNSSAHSDNGATHNINGNEITGNITTISNSNFYAIYHNYANCLVLNMNNNYVHDIDLGTSTSSGPYSYMVYANYNNTKFLTMSNNRVRNIKRLGPAYAIYAFYTDQYNNATTGGTMVIEHNKIVNVKGEGNFIYSMYNGSSYNAPHKMTVRYNKIDSMDLTGALSYNYIYNFMGYYGGDSSVVSFDTMTNWFGCTTNNGSGYTYFYNYNYMYYGQVASRVSNNYMNNWIGNYGYIYNYMGYYVQYVDTNIMNNFTLGINGSTNGGIYNYVGMYGTNGYCRNNRMTNFSVQGSMYIYNYLGYYGTNSTPYVVNDNLLRKMSATSTGGIYNYILYGYGGSARRNRVDSLSTVSGPIYGMMTYATTNSDTLDKNIVSQLSVTGTSNTVYGYYLQAGSAGINYHFTNNFMTNIEVPTNYSSQNIFGVYTTGTGDYKLYNNTIRISPSVPNTSTGSSGMTGVYYATSGTFDFRNNIVHVNYVPSGAGGTYALRRASGTAATKPANFSAASNSNIYYVPTTSAAAFLYGEGAGSSPTNAYNMSTDPQFNKPCGAYKTFMGAEFGSFQENNLVAGTAPGTYIPSGTSYAEKGGTATSNPAVIDDWASVARPIPSDIGALQFSGTAQDDAPPQIAYTPVDTTSYCLSAPTIVATITDQTGVDVSTSGQPKLFYKLSTEANAFPGGSANNVSTFNGWKYKDATTISGNQFTFTPDYTKLTSAVVPGSVIQYFIIAQDITTNVNTAANMGTFTICPTSVNLSTTNALNTSPAPNQYKILVPGSFTIKAAMPSICVSGATTITVSPNPVGTTLQWESATPTGTFSAIAGATSPTYNTGFISTTTRYRLVISCGSGVLQTTTPVTVSMNNPSLVSTTGATRCGWGPLVLTGTPSTGATLNWYASATSTTPIAQGNTFNTGNLGSSVTYYVSAVVPKGNVEELGKKVPSLYSYFSGTITGYGMNVHFSDTTDFYQTTIYAMNNGTSNLEVELIDMNPTSTNFGGRVPGCVYSQSITSTGFNLAGKYTLPLNWTNIPPGDYRMALGSNNTSWLHIEYKSPTWYPMYSNMTGRTWLYGAYAGGAADYYYMFFYDNTVSGPCENPVRTAVTATVNPSTPIVASSPQSPGVCTGSSATLNVTSTSATYLYTWSPAATLNTASGASVTATPPSSTKYYVNGQDVLNGCTAIDSITIAVNPKQNPPTITPATSTICQNGNVLLTATPSSPFGGTATIGTGTSSPGNYGWPAPLQGYYPANHEQYIVRASELIAAGVQPGAIKSIAFYVDLAGNASQNLTIKLAPTTASSFTSSTLINTGFTTVFAAGPSGYTPGVVGNWNTIPFTTPFQWDGVSNIVVDMTMIKCNTCPIACGAVYGTSYSTRYSTASFTSSAYTMYAADCSTVGFTPSTTCTTNAWRPNMQFNWVKPYSINWLNVTGLYKNFPPLSGAMTTADTNSKAYASPATTQTYTAVTNAQGCVSNASTAATVNINPAPPTAITPAGAQTICSGSTLVLNAPSGASNSYQWLLNNGIITTGGTSSTYTATAAGSYRVRVVNLTTGCFDTTAVPTVITVNPLPTATIAAGGTTTFCNGGSVVLTLTTNASPAAIQWFNGGVAIPGATSSTYTATASGTYTAEVTNSNQCKQISNAVTVTVNVLPTTVTTNGPTTFCSGGSVTMCVPTTGTGAPFTYQWYLGGSPITSATGNCYTASAAGTYYVIVTSASTGCSGQSLSSVVAVGSAPSSSITPTGTFTICDRDSLVLKTNSQPGLTYQWKRNGSNVGTNDSFYVAKLGGTYTVNVAVTSQPSCNSTTTSGTVLNVNPLPTVTASAGGPTTFCQGGNVILTASSATAATYRLNLNGSPIGSTQTSPSFTVTQAGRYTISGFNSTNCSDTSGSINVTVNPLPALAITSSGPTNFCQGGTTTLTATSGLSNYQWFNNGNPITGATTTTLTVTSTGVYTVRASNTNNCFATSQPAVIQVNPAPPAITTPTDTVNICAGKVTTITTPFNSSYGDQWKRNGINLPLDTFNSITTGQSGSYTVLVTNRITGCSTLSLAVVVNVLPPPTASASRQGAATICSNDSSELSAATVAGLSYQWNMNGSPIAGATTTKYFAKAQGTYTVTTTNVAGCSATSSPGITINVNPAPPAYITYNTPLTFCDGSAVVLTANTGSGIIYTWYVNDTAITNTTSSNIATTTGVYKIRTTNSFGCTTLSDTVKVTAYPKPNPSITRAGTTLSTTTTFATYQWFFNNNAVGGATAQSFTFTQNGAYKVRVTTTDGCEGFSELIFVQNVGITPSPISAAIKVYPNPTTGLLKVDAPVKLKLAIRDVTGKVVAEGTGVKELDITDAASGTYLLYISDMDGKLLRADKVTKTAN